MCDSYKPVSKYYDTISSIYSLGQIPKCRNAFIREILEAPKGRNPTRLEVCFAGAGHAVEAISLAEEGALVTVVDTSASMLEVFQRKLSHGSDDTKARVKIIHGDIRNVSNRYDWVVANFFLNVFPESEMVKMVDTLLEKCRSHGSLVVGDFYYNTEGNGFKRTLQKMNWALALSVFRILVKNANHPIYDYRVYLSKRGWNSDEVKQFGLLGVSFYQSEKFTKIMA